MLFPIPVAPLPAAGTPVNVAAFGIPIDHGIQWEDPREVHRVVVRFRQAPADPRKVRLEYWSSRWPDQRLPRDREPGGGDVGWWELGNWYTGEWKRADTEATLDGPTIDFRFRPMNERERTDLKGFDARYRFTLKIRVASDGPLPDVGSLEAYSDSVWEERAVRLVFDRAARAQRADLTPGITAYNGYVKQVATERDSCGIRFLASRNPNPNSFDRTLLTVRRNGHVVTFQPQDLNGGPLIVPSAGMAVLPEADARTYAQVAAARKGETLYDRVKELPEQTWESAWTGMPPKKSYIYIPLGLDGGRQRFRLDADGGVVFRTNDHFLRARPGKDTPRLDLEPGPVHASFGLPDRPANRTLLESTLPVVESTWEQDGIQIRQESFVTELDGARADGPVPQPDAVAVWMARFALSNASGTTRSAHLAMGFEAGDRTAALSPGSEGAFLVNGRPRGLAVTDGPVQVRDERLRWDWTLPPGESRTVLIKLPYVVLTTAEEQAALAKLDFDREREAAAGYWRRREDKSARLITPEPMLNEFYRAHAMHLLVNCEGEPGAERRFARVGSFGYGAYGNESCMMVVDLDRRGYHKEAQECLDAWLHYQGTVGLPGDFDTKDGVLYGAGGYEAGGYNQHHGWILWCLAEHYRFTHDRAWLERAAPGILKGADWIIRERARTADRKDIARGLLPAGSLEDIGDWWPWLSTNCYTWRGLDSAAWALEQIHHLEAARIRKQADDYHRALLAAFHAARDRSPVVRLRDGTAVPHIPSTPYRRGRSFGWICETLEGALHLLITRAIDPRSPEAEWILQDYEDNLFLSNQYGYTLADFDKHWFGRGGMSMQACLLLDAEPYLARDDVKNALRAIFNAIAVGYFPDARMLTEHALPEMGDWRGDHYKSSDEANACGWLRYLFVREEGGELLLGQAVPRAWLAQGKRCGIERAATFFGPVSVVYEAGDHQVTATVDGPKQNPPKRIRLRFRIPGESPLASVTVNGKPWHDMQGEWVDLPGRVGRAVVRAEWR